jgi:hypothetical protein
MDRHPTGLADWIVRMLMTIQAMRVMISCLSQGRMWMSTGHDWMRAQVGVQGFAVTLECNVRQA